MILEAPDPLPESRLWMDTIQGAVGQSQIFFSYGWRPERYAGTLPIFPLQRWGSKK